MKNDSILFIGLDTHKTNTEVAYVIDGRENSPQHFGKILTNKQAFIKLARQLQSLFQFKQVQTLPCTSSMKLAHVVTGFIVY